MQAQHVDALLDIATSLSTVEITIAMLGESYRPRAVQLRATMLMSHPQAALLLRQQHARLPDTAGSAAICALAGARDERLLEVRDRCRLCSPSRLTLTFSSGQRDYYLA